MSCNLDQYDMRDEFTEDVKRNLAARTGNSCSNPECGALTSGPQSNSTKALNVGLAAHITAAAEGGQRYDALLSPEQRRHQDNGIWLCQTCAKLIDNDAARYTEKLLRAWKEIAEDRALYSIGKTARPVPESDSQRKLRASLPWKDKTIKLSEMTPPGTAVMLIGPVRGSSFVQVFDCTEFFVTVGKLGSDGFSRCILLANVEINGDPGHDCLELQVRYS
jgi:hypothetical protein